MIHSSTEFDAIKIGDGDRTQHDRNVATEVQDQDCYGVRKLTADGFRPKLVVDIGAHIGTFSMMARKYWPDAAVLSFELEGEYFELLKENAHECILVNEPVFGFLGYEEGHAVHAGHDDWEKNFRSLHPSRGLSVRSLFQKFALSRIDFLKIDCEESEVNIFMELDFLGRMKDVGVIYGEWHFCTAKEVLRTIVSKTHAVTIVDEGDWNYFHATPHAR